MYVNTRYLYGQGNILIMLKVQNGSYWPGIKLGGAALCFVAVGESVRQFRTDESTRSFSITFVCLSIVAAIIFSHLLCQREFIVDSGRVPERLKIRNSNASRAGLWGSWTWPN